MSRSRRGGACRVAAALVLAALALTGCETTAEKSAKLERKAKLEKAANPAAAEKGLSIAHKSSRVRVLGASLLHSSEGAAAAVTVSNRSAHALRAVPIAITVKDAHGKTVFQNNAPGLEAALTSISSLPAHGVLTWVDDQIPSTSEPVSVSALLGEAARASGAQPRIETQGPHVSEEAPGEVSGAVRNRSAVAQQRLVAYVIAKRAGKIVAAGRAVLADVPAGASAPFHAFLIGSTEGAQLTASAPPTTFG